MSSPTFVKSSKILGILWLLLIVAVASVAQDPGASSSQLTDAQAQALMKKLSAAAATARPLTAAEINKLLQYVAGQKQAAQPKKIRVGIVMPQANLGPGFSGDAVGGPLRDLIAHYLSGPMMELVAIDALVSQQVDAEAQSKQCAFVLYTAASQKKTGGNGLGVFKGATTMANMMPMVQAAKVTGGMLSAAGSAATAATTAQEAASLSKAVKAKNEISLEYKLQAPGNPAVVAHDVLSAKANADGEDVLTPLVGKLAEAVATQVTNTPVTK